MSFWNFAGAIGGALLGGNLGQSGARQQMRFNAEQARLNREFQERMSSTAHQRQVADLRKAGLNPILSASQGGAQTPSGGQASTSLNPLEHAAHSAANLALMTAQAKKLRAEANKVEQNARIDKPKEQVQGTVGDVLEVVIDKGKDLMNNSAQSLKNQTDVSPLQRDKPLPKSKSMKQKVKERYTSESYERAKKKSKIYNWWQRNFG